MKHKQNIIRMVSAIGGLMLLLSGCARIEEGLLGGPGSKIRFTAASTYDNGPATKTVYSGTGAFSGSTLTTERINWVTNDQMTINYAHGSTAASANYDVTSVTQGSATNSNASVQAASSGSELVWEEGSGDHVFHAMYPSRAFSANGSSASLNGNSFSGIIPATQVVTRKQLESGAWKYEPNMKYGYMVATTTVSSVPADAGINLYFKPAMTAFEFVVGVKTGDPALTLNTFQMTSTGALTGTFSAKLNGTDAARSAWTDYSSSSTGSSISVDFRTGSTGITINPGSSITFTVFALPQTLNNITVKFGTSAGDKTLELKQGGSFISFNACKKYRITNLTMPHWTYTIEEIDDIILYGHETASGGYTVKSYRESSLNPGVKEPVKWRMQYLAYNGQDSVWVNYPAGGISPDANTTFSVSVSQGPGGSTGVAGTATVTGTSSSTIQGDPGAADAIRARLATATQRGSQQTPFDLSTHPTYGSIDTEDVPHQTTANCYVVSAPGYYMFPCVYGNGITNGSFNVSAYNPSASTATLPVAHSNFTTLGGVNTNLNVDANHWVYYAPTFRNAANRAITSTPVIKADLGISSFQDAIVLWQDTEESTTANPNQEIIPYDANHIWMTTKTINGRTLDYICFKIDRENIQPGNIVIALRGGGPGLSGTNNILWSWHIWVTEKDLSPTDVVTNAAGTFYMMPKNLGWMDAVDGSVTRYASRIIKYRAIQVDDNDNPITGGDDEPFYLKERGDVISVDPSLGTNPYYQWGRKDPMFPVVSDTETKHISRHPSYRSTIVTTGNPNQPTEIGYDPSPDFGKGIRNPYVAYYNLIDGEGHGSLSWVGGTYYPWYEHAGYLPNRLDQNPFSYSQYNTVNATGLTDALVTDLGGSWIMQYVAGDASDFNSYVYFIHHYSTTLADHPLTSQQVQSLLFDQTNHFTLSDFTYTATPYAASLRSNSTVVYNLWNSYIYQEDVPNSTANKFKTIYDPCPPGFTVPTNKVYLATTTPAQMQRGSNYTVEKSTGGRLPAGTPVTLPVSGNVIGVNFGTMFYPFTGVRSYQTNQGAGYGPNSGNGYYWTDQPFQIDAADDRPGGNHDWTDIRAFSFHHSAYIFSCNAATHQFVSALTKQFGAAIRPMVDPQVTYGRSSASQSSPLPTPSGATPLSW